MAEEIELRYIKLKDKVKKLLDAQKEYFRTRDGQKLIIAKSLEKEVSEMVNPKPKSQAEIDWLGQ